MYSAKIAVSLITIGFLLILAGFIFLIFEMFIHGDLSSSGSVIIFIGPIPLVFAWGELGFQLVIVALILITMILMIIILFRDKRYRRED